MQKTSIHVSVLKQELKLRRGRKIIRRYPVSTSRFGLGTRQGSNKTPLGKFRISDKIGEEMPSRTIFVGRLPLGPDDPPPGTNDLVLSRILWLDGVEGHNANTRERFIYIHGTRHEDKIGLPDSHGCVRMRNADVIELFDLVEVGTPVTIRK
ncbi:MAG: murein L,D-transpeptidase [Chthoniobacterales bacterium]|nr:MAG: murein L,D-transpeptidase [Chthoniobacterales bacterium]